MSSRDGKPIRILLCDDNSGFRDLIRAIIKTETEMQIVGEAADGLQGVELVKRLRPDVVLLDLSMPVMDGFAALPRIKSLSPHSKVIVMSGFEASALSDEALRRGATSYIEKGVGIDRIIDELRTVAALPARNPLHPRDPVGVEGSDDLRLHLASIVECSGDAIISETLDGVIVSWNTGAQKLYGYSPEEAIGARVSLVAPEDRCHEVVSNREKVRRGEQVRHFETIRQTKDRKSIHVSLTVSPVMDETGRIVGVSEIARDLTDQRILEYHALHDFLTQLPNRSLLTEQLGHALARTKRRQEPTALLFLDLDGFKAVNDRLGHSMGDKLLIEVAVRMKTALRASDIVARFGGDEFGVVMEGTDELAATVAASKILDALSAPFSLDGHEVNVSASIGITVSGSGEETIDALLRRADAAMYAAKQTGKGHYEFFDARLETHLTDRLQLEAALRRALQREEFVVHYQPIIDLRSMVVDGAEALVRWSNPERGLLPANDFIGLTEQNGLIHQLGAWVLSQACRWASEWQHSSDRPPIAVSVNLSANQLQHEELVNCVSKMLAETDLEPRSLILELTETVMMQNITSTANRIREIKDLGVRFAIDDFGVGYSSINYLSLFPIDILKIDKAFVQGVCENAKNSTFALAMIEFGHALGLKIVAEGIERPDQLSRLRDLGCEYGQGFYIAEPCDAADPSAFFGPRAGKAVMAR